MERVTMENDAKQKTPRGGNAKTHRVRTADQGFIELHPYNKNLSIACMCTECLGFETNPIDCTAITCPLFPYRRKTQKTMRGEK